jgi:hypothetical protein
MFKRLAKFQDARLRGPGLRQVASHWPEATHANDNLQSYRRAAGLRRSPPPKLVCHWVLTGTNRIECRWIVEEPDGDSYQNQIIQTAA